MTHCRCRRHTAFTLIELLVVIAIIAILIGLLVPAVQKVREASQRAECSNNLKNLGIALHHHHDVYKGFPAARNVRATPAGTIAHGWVPYIFPYIEQEPLYKQYNFNVTWSSPVNDGNGKVNQTHLSILYCPATPGIRRGSNGRGITDYSPPNQITRPNPFFVGTLPASDPTFIGVLGNNILRKAASIDDGASNTLLLAESGGRNQCWKMGKMVAASGCGTGAWANPTNDIVVSGFDPATMRVPGPCVVNCNNDDEVYGFHPGGAMGLLADGSVRLLRANLTLNTMIALTTRASGEVITGALD